MTVTTPRTSPEGYTPNAAQAALAYGTPVTSTSWAGDYVGRVAFHDSDGLTLVDFPTDSAPVHTFTTTSLPPVARPCTLPERSRFLWVAPAALRPVVLQPAPSSLLSRLTAIFADEDADLTSVRHALGEALGSLEIVNADRDRTEQQRRSIAEALANARAEHDRFRTLVRDTALSVADEQGWCTEGLNRTLDVLGLDRKVTTYIVRGTFVLRESFEVEVEAKDEDEAVSLVENDVADHLSGWWSDKQDHGLTYFDSTEVEDVAATTA